MFHYCVNCSKKGYFFPEILNHDLKLKACVNTIAVVRCPQPIHCCNFRKILIPRNDGHLPIFSTN